ncbi:hypothetical protein [Dyella sp. C11]|uniref:hypothetical protein n=1 Tax=Dyella sp. C11 TaxID=2126991 RepID=UPI000D656F22|nr:hypothetical protein [Dyella sp. C11]
MTFALTLISTLLWWVLYSSIGALFLALIAWSVLRWAERCPVVFNRTYFACLVWCMIGLLSIAGVAIHEGITKPPYALLLTTPLLRGALVVDMVIGVVVLWRLIPRVDAHRIRPTSACMAVAVLMAVSYGAATALA